MSIVLRPACDIGVIKGREPARSCAANAYPWILAATIVASAIVFIDGSAVNIALPIVQTELHATNAQAQWIIEAYSLFLSALLLLGGSLGDRVGRKRVFLWGVVAFTFASVLCAAVQTASQLIAARALEGAASALLTPGSLSILGASIDEARRGRAVGTWSSFSVLSGVAGPLIGGLIVQHASWRWIFLINVPLAIAVVAMTLRWVPESEDEEEGRSEDWLGALLATVGLGAVVYALIASSFGGWTSSTIGWLAGGIAVLILFVLAERWVRSPMMPLELFASRTFSIVNLQTLLLYAALGGATFLLPFNFILIQHYTPVASGLTFLPFVILVSLLSPWVGTLSTKIGVRTPLLIGPVIVTIAFLALSRTGIGGSYWTQFFVPIVLWGLGMALVITPLTTTVIASAGHRFGIASAVNNAVARAAGLLAVAALSLVVASGFNRQLDNRLAHMSLPKKMVAAVNAQRPNLAAAKAPPNAPAFMRKQAQEAIDESYVAGFRQAMLVAGALSAAAAACGLALPRKS